MFAKFFDIGTLDRDAIHRCALIGGAVGLVFSSVNYLTAYWTPDIAEVPLYTASGLGWGVLVGTTYPASLVVGGVMVPLYGIRQYIDAKKHERMRNAEPRPIRPINELDPPRDDGYNTD